MSEVNWQQIEDIFSKALELPRAERERFVSEKCAGNAKLCRELLEMLAADENSADLIEKSIVAPDSLADLFAEKILSEPVSLALSGKNFGKYKVLKKLGGGGMGAVYLGTDTEQAEGNRVAVKFIKRGLDNNFNLRRFRHEQKILEAFDHPNITKFLDVGITENGLPFLVMEYVKGSALFDYCRLKNLSLREKLELFRVILGAVEYAHYHKVIHRDLKPSNILVTDEGNVKLLDFGIAKILDSELVHESINPTATLFRPLTPEYASPEQVKGETMTTNSDIYSLGILFFELLTGERPYKIAKSSPYEIIRAVCEKTPQLLSEIFKKRPYSDEKFQDFYESDELFLEEIDKVSTKCLQKKSENRYESVIELDADIERILNGKKVRASAPIRENRAESLFAVSASPTNSLAILPFTLLNTESGAEKANIEFLGVGLADVLTTRLSNLEQIAVRPTSSVLQLISKGLEVSEISRQLKVDCLLEGHILTVENHYRINVKLLSVADHRVLWAAKFDERESNLFQLQDLIAEKVFKALVPQIAERGNAPRELAKTSKNISDQAFEAFLRGRFYWHSYTFEGILKSEKYFKQAIELDPNFSIAYAGLADYYNWLGVAGCDEPENSFLLAKKNALQALRLDRNSPEAFASLAFAVWAYDWDSIEAENLYRRALEINRNYPRAHEWYAYLLSSENRHEEALEAITCAEKLDPNSSSLMAMHGFILYNARRYEEAYAKNLRALELQPDYYLALQGLGWICPQIGKFEEGIESARKAVDLSNLPAINEWSLALALAETGNLDEARKITRNIEARMRREHIPPYYLAVCHAVLGESEKAFDWLEKAVEERGYWTRWMTCEPRLDTLREDARFKRLTEKIKPLADDRTDENIGLTTGELNPSTRTFFTIKKRKKTLQRAVAAFVLFAGILSLSLYFAFRRSPAESSDKVTQNFAEKSPDLENTLVILPFTSNGSRGDGLLGKVLADELKSNLGRFKKLSVLSLDSFSETSAQDIGGFGKSINADFILRGDLQNSGTKTELSAELFSVKNGATIWQENFAVANNEIPTLRGQIAERILNVLAIELSSTEREYIAKPYTRDSEAFQLYNAGRYHLAERKLESFEKAIANFSEAIERDPTFALAYAGLADVYALKNNMLPDSSGENLEKAERLALQALALDDSLAEAHTSLGFIKSKKKGETATAESHYRRAIELNPSYSPAYHWFATFLLLQHRPAEALEAIEKAARIEPRSAVIQTARATIYGKMNRFEESFSHFDKAIEIDRGFAPAYIAKSYFQQIVGDYQGAVQTFTSARIYNNFPETDLMAKVMTIQNAASQGRREAVFKDLKEVVQAEAFRKNVSHFALEIALVYNLLDEPEKTFEWFDKIDSDEIRAGIPYDLRFKNLQNDVRFLKIVEENRARF